jgi:hypothetical protein
VARLRSIIQTDFAPPPAPTQTSITEDSSFATQIPHSADSTLDDITPPATSKENQENHGPVPDPVQASLESTIKTITTYFGTYPPHTIQRLSELILQPKQHYRSSAAYLHALDRVVHVTSGAQVYPLPAIAADLPRGTLGASSSSTANPDSSQWGSTAQAFPAVGSDESLGGALLTPIPWLKPISLPTNVKDGSPEPEPDMDGEGESYLLRESTEMVDGPNGAGSVETVSVSLSSGQVAHTGSASADEAELRANGAVTQGELLRQEQEAGVVPAAQLAHHSHTHTPSATGEEGVEDEETPHARGPEEIGMEDMGPQRQANPLQHGMQGIDVAAAVGRRAEEDEMNELHVAQKRGVEDGVADVEGKRLKTDVEAEKEKEGEAGTGDGEGIPDERGETMDVTA